jgi:NAD(P)-dependent dehydrogenase (short-subunit alcohol dehydrogenase family)
MGGGITLNAYKKLGFKSTKFYNGLFIFQMSSQKLQGKVAFITGSARNMGASFALALANHGASVVIHHRGNSQKEAEALAAKIQQLGGKTLIVTGELASVKTIRDIFTQIKQSLGRLDIGKFHSW